MIVIIYKTVVNVVYQQLVCDEQGAFIVWFMYVHNLYLSVCGKTYCIYFSLIAKNSMVG